MTVQLVPPGNAPPGGDWAYCTSENGVPEQINLQVMCRVIEGGRKCHKPDQVKL
jgi:hypothetical protein